MRLRPFRRFTNKSRGQHEHGRGGSSNEFADFRDYVAGDDMRNVDWNIFARLNRPYVKLYRQEEDMHVVLLVDASKSMDFDGKFLKAQQLAAAIAMMGIQATERISIQAFAGQQLQRLDPCTGRASLQKIFSFVERLGVGGQVPVEKGIEQLQRYHKGRGMVVILSDFLTMNADLKSAFNRLFSTGLEIYGIQILAPVERNPELTGDLRFVDSETEQLLDVTAVGGLLEIYHEYRSGLENDLTVLCQQRSGRFISVDSTETVEGVLFDTMKRKGWVK